MNEPLRMREPPRVPIWLPAIVLAITSAGLLVAIVWGNWLTVASFALLTVTWSLLLFNAIRVRRPRG